MKLAVLSDIHGNRVALDAVIADARQQGADSWWVLGDLVAIGPDPIGTIERLVDLSPVSMIRGNTERYVLTGDRPPPTHEDAVRDPSLLPVRAAVERSFSWTRDTLAAHGLLEWIEALPDRAEVQLPDGAHVLGVHATPVSDDGPGICPHRPDEELEADLISVPADVVIGGHTHQPTDRRLAGRRVLNGGSVSNPITDDLRASYLIVHASADGYRVDHRRVAYDVDSFLRVLERSGHPEVDYIASFQRGEQFRYPALRDGAPVAHNN